MSPDPAARDARLPPAVQGVVARGETCWLCDHPRALPAAGSTPADWVVLPLAFAWLYPDSMLVLESLEFARLGLILHGEWGSENPEAALKRLTRILASLHLTTQLATPTSRTTVVIARRIPGSN